MPLENLILTEPHREEMLRSGVAESYVSKDNKFQRYKRRNRKY